MKTVVLLSGGIDSTVLLAHCVKDSDQCHAITFNYGQRAYQREHHAASAVADHYQIPHLLINLPPVFGASALLGTADMPTGHAEKPDTTTVPGRNLLMLAAAAALAQAHDYHTVMFGAIRDDRAGYADCRWQFIEAANDATYYGSNRQVTIAAPLTAMTKAQVIAHGRELDAPLHLTWSCYTAGPEPCGVCGACQLAKAAL